MGAFPDDTAINVAEFGDGQAGHLVDSSFEAEQAPVAAEMTENAR
ncbi:hypothetical protein ACFSZS_28995 [Seohaeicola zhoushanensis]